MFHFVNYWAGTPASRFLPRLQSSPFFFMLPKLLQTNPRFEGDKERKKTPNLLALLPVQPAALLFPTLPPFCPKIFLEAVPPRAWSIWISEGVALSLRMPCPFTWFCLFPLRDLKRSDRSSFSSLQNVQGWSCDFWLNKFRAVKRGVFF